MANYSSTVDCAEEAGSVSENYDDARGVMKASVQLRCAWADRHDLVADICGNRLAWPKGAAGLVPTAATAGIVPVMTPGTPEAGDQQEVIYGEALVTINYTTEFVDVVSEAIEPTTEFLTLDYRGFRWGSGSGLQLREEEAPGKLVRGINFVRNEVDKTSLPSNLLSFIGHCNQSAVVGSILNLTFPAETLLYAPPSINYKKDSSGAVKFDITKKFTYNEQTWNKFFRPQIGVYQRIYAAGSSTPYYNYPVSDISGLFA